MRLHALLIAAPLLAVAACDTPPRPLPDEPERAEFTVGPRYVEVDHILIGVANPKLPGVTRDAEAADALAYEILAKLQNGADWAVLKQAHTDDRRPDGELGGPYAMANAGVAPRHDEEFARTKMVKGFGDVSFGLEVGGIGIADYHPDHCKWGYHIVKRVK